MKTIKKHVEDQPNGHGANSIKQMIEDKKAIIKAVKRGDKVSSIKGIKIVSPL